MTRRIPRVPLGTVAKVQSGYAFKSGQFQPHGVRLLRNTNILPGKVYWDDTACLSEDRAARFDDYALRAGDILLSLDRPIISGGIKIARVTASDLPALLVQRVGRFHLDPSAIDADYLYTFLNGPSFIRAISGHDQSLGVPHISPSQVEAVRIPLPGLSEQRRIARELEASLELARRAQLALRVQTKEIAKLREAMRREVFQQLQSANFVTMGTLLTSIETGKSFQTSERPARPDELGVIKVSAVSWGQFRPDEAKAIDADYTPRDHHRIRAGDVIVSRANTRELVGAIARSDRDFPNRLLSDKTWRLIVDESRCDPEYLVVALRLREARAHIEGNATGTSDSMRNISQYAFCATPLRLPPLHEQQRLAMKMKHMEAALDVMSAGISQSQAEARALPGKVLACVFDLPLN